MRLTEIAFDGPTPIDGYGPGFFRFAGKVHEGPLLLLPGGSKPWRGLDDLDAILAAKDEIDVVFFGMGAEIAPLPGTLRRALEEAEIGVEIMASPAACRTYNILLAEGRRIAAALLPV